MSYLLYWIEFWLKLTQLKLYMNDEFIIYISIINKLCYIFIFIYQINGNNLS